MPVLLVNDIQQSKSRYRPISKTANRIRCCLPTSYPILVAAAGLTFQPPKLLR
nr:MAG TPA: hypothetical protein [Caudoviricetes sp.]